MRILLRVLGSIAGGVVLLLIAVAIAVSTIDVKSLVGPIQARVKRETGRDLLIGGIAFKLSLEPKLVATDITLGNAPWAKAPAMISAKTVEAQVALLPLLRRRFETVRLKFIEPVIALETDAQGQRNWDFGGAGAAPATPGAPSGDAGLALFASGNLAIDKGTLTYYDGASRKTTAVVIERMLLSSRSDSSPLDAEFRGSFDGVPIAVTGKLAPLDALARPATPSPIALDGEIGGQRVSFAAKFQAKDNASAFDDVSLAFGESRITGELTVTRGAARPVVAFKLSAPTLSGADLPIPVRAPDVKAKPSAAAPSRWVFDDTPVSFEALRSFDADGEIAIARLLLSEGRHADDVRATISLHAGVLDIPTANVATLGGTAAIRLHADTSRDPDNAIKLAVNAKALDLGVLAAMAGVHRDIKGGKTDLTLDLAMRGASPRRWMASANGSVAATVGPASWAHIKGDMAPEFDRLAQVVNPFRSINAATELKCAVVRLPIRNGVAQVDRTIALETRELGVAASGTLDFRNETLDLAVKAHLKQGIPINVVQLADLVRVGGTFKSPAVRVDSGATAEIVARIGMAIGTGGWSEGARLLLKPPGGDANTCDVAAGHAPPEPAPASPGSASGKGSANPAEEITKALGRLLGR